MHFFNPVPVLKLVEVIRALQTSDETTTAIVELAADLGKIAADNTDAAAGLKTEHLDSLASGLHSRQSRRAWYGRATNPEARGAFQAAKIDP